MYLSTVLALLDVSFFGCRFTVLFASNELEIAIALTGNVASRV
jgi:hypothetical protein